MVVRKITLFACAALAGLALAWMVTRPPPDTAPGQAPGGPLAVQRPPISEPLNPSGGFVKATSVSMRNRFEQAPNYAAFIQDAMQRPDEGGRFYALIAWHRCADVATARVDTSAPLVGSVELRAKAGRIVDELQQRCNGVKAQFPDELSFMRALKMANARGQPDVLLIERGALTGTAPESADRDLARAIGSGDPYLLAATLEINVHNFASKIDPRYAHGNNLSVLNLASAAAACDIVGDCIEHRQVMMACHAAGQCAHADLRDYLRDGLDADAANLFDKTKAALLRLAKAPN